MLWLLADLYDPARTERGASGDCWLPATTSVRLSPGAWVSGAVWRLRVSSTSYAKAEDVLLRILRELKADHQRRTAHS
ncbi:hypothetical protein ACFQ0Q_48060 [Streptomyces aureus]